MFSNIRNLLCIFMLSISPFSLLAQEIKTQHENKISLSEALRQASIKDTLKKQIDSFKNEFLDKSWNKIRNSSYGSIIGANGNTNSIGNYGSLDPLNGSLSFKGVIAIGDPKKRVSYLSLQANADLVSESYASIFRDTKLNTNAGVQAEYNVRIGASLFRTLESDEANYMLQKGLLKSKKDVANQKFERELKATLAKKSLIDMELQLRRDELNNNRKLLAANVQKLGAVLSDPKTQVADKVKLQNAVNSAQLDIEKLEKLTEELVLKSDSLSLILQNSSGLKTFNELKEKANYENGKTKLQNDFPFSGRAFTWLTFTAGTGRKDFYTYNRSLPFGEQIANPFTTTFKLGVAVNHYRQESITGKGLLLNAGFLRIRDNNITKLSTQSVTQDVSYKNSTGDTTRKISKTYPAYTDPIEEFRQWNVYSNIFYIMDNGKSGLHFFPSFSKTDHKTGYLDLGFGYILSFTSSKTGSANFNLEGYVILNDTFDSIKTGNKLWDRNNIGIRATFPFNYLFKP